MTAVMVTVATVFSDTKDMKLHVLFNSSTDQTGTNVTRIQHSVKLPLPHHIQIW
jgi:hypothetical protein